MEDTFSLVQKIQHLVKKTFSVGKSLDFLKSSIDIDLGNYSRIFLKNKIHINEYFDSQGQTNIKYKISKQALKDLGLYTDPLIISLRQNQNIVYELLTHCTSTSSKEQISSLIGNMFYDNIFSKNSFDFEYLIILTRIILNEIDSVTNVESINAFKNFINQSIFDYLIKTFHRNNEIRDYFKKILTYALLYIDQRESGNVLHFEPKKLEEVYESLFKGKKQVDEELEKQKLENFAFQKMANAKESTIENTMETPTAGTKPLDKPLMTEETFMNNYGSILEISYMEQQLDEINEKSMKSFYIKNINYSITSNVTFSTKQIINDVFKYHEPHKILQLYRINFSIVVQIIEDIIYNLKKHINIIPPSIKYLCKIMELALLRKFPNIQASELYSFIGKFFFEKMMGPIFKSPHIYGIINSSIILDSTKETTDIIMTILNKVTSMYLFTSQEDAKFTFFNWFILKRIDNLMQFFSELLSSTQLPPFIMKIINNHNTLSQNEPFDITTYTYNYFNEHKNENSRTICILYSAEQIYEIVNVFNQHSDLLNKNKYKDIPSYKHFKLSCEKLKMKLDVIQNEIEISQEQQIRLFRMKQINEKTQQFNKMEKVLTNKYLPLNLAVTETTENKYSQEKYIQLAKLSLINVLENLINLNDCYFMFKENITDTTVLLSYIKEMLSFRSMILQNSISIKWGLSSFAEQLKGIPSSYKEQDYKLFYKELIYELESNLKELETFFIELSQLNETTKYLEKKANEVKDTVRMFKEGKLNAKIKHFIQTEEIPISFVCSEKNGKKKFVIDQKPKKSSTISTTIQQFCNDFPQLWKVFNFKQIDIIEQGKELNIADSLNTYYERLKKHLINKYEQYQFDYYEQEFINEFIESEKQEEIDKVEDQKKEMVRYDDDDELLYEECQVKTKDKKIDDKPKTYKKNARQKVIDLIFASIKNFVLNRIYDRIHPSSMTHNDEIFFITATALHFAEPRHFTSDNKAPNIHIDDVLEASKKTINYIENSRTPYQKIILLNEVFQIINKKFTHELPDKTVGYEDMLPFLLYLFIQSSPKTIVTDLDFIETYGQDYIRDTFGHLFTTAQLMVRTVLSFNYNDYKNVCTVEEFDNLFFKKKIIE